MTVKGNLWITTDHPVLEDRVTKYDEAERAGLQGVLTKTGTTSGERGLVFAESGERGGECGGRSAESGERRTESRERIHCWTRNTAGISSSIVILEINAHRYCDTYM